MQSPKRKGGEQMPREYLIDYRNKHGLKSVEMAKMLDLSESYYNQIEKGIT